MSVIHSLAYVISQEGPVVHRRIEEYDDMERRDNRVAELRAQGYTVTTRDVLKLTGSSNGKRSLCPTWLRKILGN